MAADFSSFDDPSKVMAAITNRTQRTTLWGVENLTNLSVEVAFGQLKSPYDIPNGIKDTGVIQHCNNAPAGADCIRDPILDTGGKPIAARYYSYSVLMKGQSNPIENVQDAGEEFYWNQAIVTIDYARGSRFADGELELEIKFHGQRAKVE